MIGEFDGPEIGPAHAPEIEISKKILDEFSRNRPKIFCAGTIFGP